MTNCEVRIATPGDVRAWFGGLPPVSLKGIVMEVEGKLEGICGIQSVRGEVTCFSMLNKECRKHKREIVKGVRLLQKMLDEYEYVVAYAAGDEPTADALLKHVGFRHVSSSINGEVYSWQRQQYL